MVSKNTDLVTQETFVNIYIVLPPDIKLAEKIWKNWEVGLKTFF
jgi:hypothetical protein